MLEVYITNLGKYNEGELCGEFLKLPATEDEVKALLSRIGVDGVLYEETFITDYETDLAGMQNLGEYESLDELNYLAVLLDELDNEEQEKFSAALELGDHTSSVKDLINLTQNLDYYDYYPDVHSEEDLGYYFIDEMNMLEIPESIRPYFDYEAYGRDMTLELSGTFTDNGFIASGMDNFTEYYGGRDDIPDEHRIFAYPDPPEKMPMKEQLAMFGKMASSSLAADRPAPAREDR